MSLSPDEKTLYVADTYGEYVLAYQVRRGRRSVARRRISRGWPDSGRPRTGPSSGADGLAIDAQGRLYVATSAGVEIFDRRGKALGVIELPKAPQNLAFAGAGGSTLYVVGRGAVWKIETLASGPANRAK